MAVKFKASLGYKKPLLKQQLGYVVDLFVAESSPQ